MRTFEQLYTAWVDGVLSREESASFEKQHPELLPEREKMLKLKQLLQENLEAPELQHLDFFTAQLMEKIVVPERRSSSWFGVPRLAWGGIASLALAFLLFLVLIPHENASNPRDQYVAEVIKNTTSDPKIRATVDSETGITVIKLDGMDKVPDDEDLTR